MKILDSHNTGVGSVLDKWPRLSKIDQKFSLDGEFTSRHYRLLLNENICIIADKISQRIK